MLPSRMSYVNNLRTFVRVYELGSMSAAGRDQRVSAAVASARIAELEKHLGVRLFNRTTRSLQPTEQGNIFYDGARQILDTIAAAEAAVAAISRHPRGSLHVAARPVELPAERGTPPQHRIDMIQHRPPIGPADIAPCAEIGGAGAVGRRGALVNGLQQLDRCLKSRPRSHW